MFYTLECIGFNNIRAHAWPGTWAFFSHLSTVSDLTNQIMIPEDWRHQNNVYRLPGLFFFRSDHARLSSLTDFVFRPAALGSLFTG